MCSQIHSFASNMGYCPQKRHMTVEKGVKAKVPALAVNTRTSVRSRIPPLPSIIGFEAQI